jgi:hypothetical protein
MTWWGGFFYILLTQSFPTISSETFLKKVSEENKYGSEPKKSQSRKNLFGGVFLYF